jgi:predicted transcriptional regulator
MVLAQQTKVMTAHIPQPLAEKVDEMAARLERSRGWVVKQALAAWVEQEDERNRLTREALADVDAGLFVDHSAVQAWSNSLGTDAPLPAPLPAAR